jgi:Uma2 family endonuclease
MLDRVECFWELPAAAEADRGSLVDTDFEADIHPLWPGILEGHPRPVFAYPVTASAYLDFDEASEIKHEFVNGFIYAMAGASDAHVTITDNLTATIRPLLRGKRCRSYSSDMKLAIPPIPGGDGEKNHPAYYFPDLFITCSEADKSPSAKMIKKEPCLVVEVLSPSTATKDRTQKLDDYKRLPTLEQYWLIEQDRRRVIVYTRDGAGWRETEHTSPHSVLQLPVEGVEIALEAIYLEVFGPSLP